MRPSHPDAAELRAFGRGLLISAVLAAMVAVPLSPLLAQVYTADPAEVQESVSTAANTAASNAVTQVQEQLINVFDSQTRAAILQKDGGGEVLTTFNPGQLMGDTIRYGFSVPSAGLANEARQRLQSQIQTEVQGKVNDYIAQYCQAGNETCYPSQAQIEGWAQASATGAVNQVATEMFGLSTNEFIGGLRDIKNFDVKSYLVNYVTDYLRNLIQWYIQQKIRIIVERNIPYIGPALAWWDSKIQELKAQYEKYAKYIEEMQKLRDLRMDMDSIGRDQMDEIFKQGSIQAIVNMPAINPERNSAGGMSFEIQAVQNELRTNMMSRMEQQASIPLAYRAAQKAKFVSDSGPGVSAPVNPPSVGNVSSETEMRMAEGKAALLGMDAPGYPYADASSTAGQQAMKEWMKLTAKTNLAYSGYMASFAAEPEIEQVFTVLEEFTPEKIDQLSAGQAFACRAYVDSLMARIDVGRLQARLREERLMANRMDQTSVRDQLYQLRKDMPISIGVAGQ